MTRKLYARTMVSATCLVIVFVATSGWSQQQSFSGPMQTKMDSIMASSKKAFDAAWDATKRQDTGTFQSFVQQGKVIMVPRGTACVVQNEIDEKFVSVSINGRKGQWVTPKVTFQGFQ